MSASKERLITCRDRLREAILNKREHGDLPGIIGHWQLDLFRSDVLSVKLLLF